MTSNLPAFLVAELRFAFRQCAQQHSCGALRLFSSQQPARFRATEAKQIPRARADPAADHPASISQDLASSNSAPETVSSASSRSPVSADQSRELVPRGRDGRAVGTGRTVDAPMKIVPKANITPNLRLTPKERLHIEILTRRAPPVVKQVKPYRERLLIYHHGNPQENALIFLKVLGLFCASTVSVIMVPAFYTAGTSLWLCGTIFLGGLFPAFFFHRLLRPLVTRVHLRLPQLARVSPEAAMKYAKNLPTTAQIDMDFTRITALPGTITVNVADLQLIPPAARWPWQIANLRWVGPNVDRGNLLRPNPTEFSVKSTVGAGRARRDVIPGLWTDVYDRLMGVTKAQVSRWKRL